MEFRYTEIQNLEESLKELVSEYNNCRLLVVDSEDNARIVAESREEMEERNLFGYFDRICSLKWDYNEGDRIVKISVHFHEDRLENEFCFRSSGNNWTKMSELSEGLAQVEKVFEEDMNQPSFDFQGINSGSMSGGMFDGLADREFTYEQMFEIVKFE